MTNILYSAQGLLHHFFSVRDLFQTLWRPSVNQERKLKDGSQTYKKNQFIVKKKHLNHQLPNVGH